MERKTAAPLDEYARKRDFAATPEPSGQPSAAPATEDAASEGASSDGQGRLRFVVQQHSATRLHWDLRLEHAGVLLSWALPKGVPWDPHENHLAVHTEDHPLQYLDFHGDIPSGQYGAGSMFVWDHGWYELHELTDAKVVATFHGERTEGRYALFATRGKDWIIHRMDPPTDPERRPIPADLQPMAPVEGELPKGRGWAYELAWSGRTVLLCCSAGTVVVRDVDGRDITPLVPEVHPITRTLGSREVVLHATLTSTGDAADQLDRRRAAANGRAVRKLAGGHPLAAMVSDVIWRDGHPRWDEPWTERRAALEELALAGDGWATSPIWRSGPKDLLEAARAQGLAGIVAKRAASPYQPGAVSPDWRLVEVAPGG